MGQTKEEEVEVQMQMEAGSEDEIESGRIPALVKEAKRKKKKGDRKGAIHCLARKKRMQADVENVREVIFNLETQILFIESAAEDREVAKAMKAAADCMESLHIDPEVGMNDVKTAIDSLVSSVSQDMMLDEDELLGELVEEEQMADYANKNESSLTTDD